MSDDEMEARRRRIAENLAKALSGVEPGQVEVRLDDNVIPLRPRRVPHDPSGAYPADLRAKWAIERVMGVRLEDADIPESTFAAGVAGELEVEPAEILKWLDGLVREVSLDKLAIAFDRCANLTGKTRLNTLIDAARE